jgi:D-glycero-alpha-D-manno-heptose-7-phosphate kinase
VKRIVVRAPTRLDFGGGWTDVPPYCENEGGFVCNIAITRYATATAFRLSPSAFRLPPSDPLLEATLRRSRLTDIALSLESDFPVGAGLGGSSAASAALLGALAAWRGEAWDHRAIAEEGRRVEVEEMGIAGGRQDHYAATFGGALALRFSDSVEVRRLAISGATRISLEERSLLVYTGQSRISGGTITGVLDAYRAREPRVLDALARMKSLAEQMAVALEAGDVDGLAALMHEHWSYQRALHPAIPTERIDEIVARAMAAGASGAKAMGASGGGCVLVMAPCDAIDRVRAAIQSFGAILPFRIDLDGLAFIA